MSKVRDLITAVNTVIRNPPIEFPQDDGTIEVEYWPRKKTWALMKPIWWYHVLSRELECGCVRRWWGTMVLYAWRCPKNHGRFVVFDEQEQDSDDR